MKEKLAQVATALKGQLQTDKLHLRLYSTDASIYQKEPLAVAYPANKDDIKTLINFARENKIPLIPRTAGTSLAGQCVGEGIVVDVSKHFTNIIEINKEEYKVIKEHDVVIIL